MASTPTNPESGADDDSPPKNFCFTVAMRYDQHLMLEAADGGITHDDPNGWDHGDGWQGPAADSLPRVAVLLGLIAESGKALESADEAVRAAAVTDLRERMIDLGSDVDESGFWGEIFEDLGWERVRVGQAVGSDSAQAVRPVPWAAACAACCGG